jgi:hypothetical protein
MDFASNQHQLTYDFKVDVGATVVDLFFHAD